LLSRMPFVDCRHMRTKLSATARSMDADNPPEISDDNFVSPSTARSNDGSGWPTQHRQFGEKR
jgi:hypothetical protein